MQRLAQIALAASCVFFASRQPAIAVDASTCGYDQGAAGWYKKLDRSGPYALDGNCGATLLGSTGGASTGSTPNGYQQITSLASSTALTVPADTAVAVVVPDGAGVRVRKDGTAPTATVGMPIPVGAYVKLYGAEIAAARFIQASTGAVLNIEYGK